MKSHTHDRHRHHGAEGGGQRGHRHEGRGGQRARHGRRRRIFDQAELHAVLLLLLDEEPRHGYDLIREIEQRSGGEYAPSPGMIYPALTYLEETGLIAVLDAEGSRKAYALTDEGRTRSEQEAEQAALLVKRLAALAIERDRTDPAPVRRAVQNLKTAAIGRLSQADADRALILKIADLIDDAARTIERMEP